ncbi:glycosyltransferase family 4 protein [Thermodesulfobacteriota bacterium]
MKISIIVMDLSSNCLGRAYLLGKVLRRHYEVEIHGFVFPHSKDAIWKPCDTGEFPYNLVSGGDFPFFLKSMLGMIKNIKGDVIYASKPRLPSYGVALLKKKISGKPLVLDIDDSEMSWFEHLNGIQRLKTILNPSGPLYTKWLESQIPNADAVTTVSTQLQHHYGRGIIVPHGKDTSHFDPKRYDRNKLREELHIKNFKTIMFLGTVRPHKGLDDIVQAINLLDRDDIRLMIIGAGSDPIYENMLKELGKDRVILKRAVPFNDIPEYLHAADLVVLPQKKTMQSYGQIPAKVFDAMAMAKPIIASNVADLPQILDGCGIIVEPGDISILAEKIAWVFSNPMDTKEMGRRAREKCIQEYSWDVMEKRLVALFDKFK